MRNNVPEKGIRYLILAAKLVLNARRNVMFIVGGDDPLSQHHKELAKRLGVASSAIFTGKIPKNSYLCITPLAISSPCHRFRRLGGL